MVALTLFGVIATMLMSGTRLSLDILDRGSSKAETLRMRELEFAVLRNQLESALPFRYWTQVDGKRVERVAFEGTETRVRFVSRHGMADGPGSLPRWIEIRREETQDARHRVVLEERRILSPGNQPSDTTTVSTDIPDCAEIRFEYLNVVRDQPRWQATWSALGQDPPLPWAVRMSCGQSGGLAKLLIRLDHAEPAMQGMRFQ